MNTKNSLPEEGQFPADDREFSGNWHEGKWGDAKYRAQLKKIHLIQDSRKLGLYAASDVVSESRRWIYPNWLPQEELTLLVGSPCTGKTTFVCGLAAGVTRGAGHTLAPGLTPTGAGHVIIINQEDNIATSLKPRLEAAGADLTKVHFIECNARSGKDAPFSFSSERDLAHLEGQAKRLDNNLGLIIIDPIYFAVDGDQNNGFKAREAYVGLARLAKRLTCAILGVAHTVRNTQNKHPLARVAGPPALREVPRAILLLSKISNGPTATGGTHVLVHAKNNEGTLDNGFEYRVTTVDISEQDGSRETAKFVITVPLIGTAEDILNAADKGIPVKSLSKFDIAVQFLRGILKDGPGLWIDVQKLAEEASISKGTLINAKSFLRIVTKKRKGDGRSVWRLPDAESTGNPLD